MGDVLGAALHGDESQLERWLGAVEDRVRGIADTLTEVVERREGRGARGVARGRARADGERS